MRPAPSGVVLDMDGVLYVGSRPLPGLRRLFQVLEGRPHLLLTNNSTLSASDCAARLAGMGVRVSASAVLTVSEAMGRHLAGHFPQGGRAQVLGGAVLREAVEGAGLEVVAKGGDLVVVGLDRALTYDRLSEAVRALVAGAGLAVTSFDPVLLTERGAVPGTGAVVAALRACVEVAPVCVGKPSPAMFKLAASRLGLAPHQLLVVGDSLAADVAGGRAAGARTALVLTGVTSRPPTATEGPLPDIVLRGLPELAALLGGGQEGSRARGTA